MELPEENKPCDRCDGKGSYGYELVVHGPLVQHYMGRGRCVTPLFLKALLQVLDVSGFQSTVETVQQVRLNRGCATPLGTRHILGQVWILFDVSRCMCSHVVWNESVRDAGSVRFSVLCNEVSVKIQYFLNRGV